MKENQKTKNSPCRIEAPGLTFGDLISETYSACGKEQAYGILRLAIDSRLVRRK